MRARVSIFVIAGTDAADSDIHILVEFHQDGGSKQPGLPAWPRFTTSDKRYQNIGDAIVSQSSLYGGTDLEGRERMPREYLVNLNGLSSIVGGEK